MIRRRKRAREFDMRAASIQESQRKAKKRDSP